MAGLESLCRAAVMSGVYLAPVAYLATSSASCQKLQKAQFWSSASNNLEVWKSCEPVLKEAGRVQRAAGGRGGDA